ncbi:MAG: CotH kinase family protein [Paludibacteraceae bacterium]|nr:CotH kinase family protein [Paludibacteraceae bacterium]
MESGDVYVFAKADISATVRLISFKFLAEDNVRNLLSDVEFDISENNVVSCFIPYILDDRNFVPTFDCQDAKLLVNDKEVISGETKLDCSLPLELKVVSGNETITYSLEIKYFTGLPIVYIDTEEKKPIESKDDYVKGVIHIVSNNVNNVPDFEASMKIKGRGNSTWQLPKKPYKMKFDEKVSLLGEPADKEWVLLANYTDKTQLRNEIAFYMGEKSSLEYTPRTNFVEVVLNGVYNGTYQLGEQLKIAKNRVNVGDDGYLLEIDARAEAEDITFRVNHIDNPINIKDPDVELGSEEYEYVARYLNTVDETLFSDLFDDSNEGYAKYIDVASFVDWYLINEIAKNADATFYTSCYMNLSREGKLKMGPLWDFDIAFGNINYNVNAEEPEGFWIKTNVAWYRRLFEDPAFVKLVKERFAYFYNNQNEIFAEINKNAEYLKYAAVENNSKWGTLYQYTWPNNEVLGSYQNEVQYLKSWLNRRFEWLNTAISAL